MLELKNIEKVFSNGDEQVKAVNGVSLSVQRNEFVAFMGTSGSGKSTLMNVLVGEELSIITPKAQTTRDRIFGIINEPNAQVVFTDTPGVLEPSYKLQENMMKFVKDAFEDADVILLVVELGEKEIKNERFFNALTHLEIPLLIALNKVDKSNQGQLESQVDH